MERVPSIMWSILPSLHLLPYSRQLTNLVSLSLLKRICHPWFSSPLASKDNNGVNISIRKSGGAAECVCDIEVEVVDNFTKVIKMHTITFPPLVLVIMHQDVIFS